MPSPTKRNMYLGVFTSGSVEGCGAVCVAGAAAVVAEGLSEAAVSTASAAQPPNARIVISTASERAANFFEMLFFISPSPVRIFFNALSHVKQYITGQ